MLDFAISFLCSFLAGMGVGGGGLLVIYLTLIKDMPQRQAQGINLVFFVVSMTVSLIIHLKNKSIYTKILPLAIPCCIAGGALGSIISKYIDGDILSWLFGCFLLISGVISLIRFIKNK